MRDTLTGMPNRVLFRSILDEACRTGNRDGIALFRIGIDEISSLRAEFGQATSDAIVTASAGRLRRSIRSGDVVAKLNDSEFALILTAEDVAEAACAAQRILDRLREPFEVSGNMLEVTVSIGVAYAGPEAADPETLLGRADIALERARATGMGAFKIFRPGYGVDPETQAAMLADLHKAIEEREIAISFQPVVSLSDLRLSGAEATMQWDHPRIGLIGSGDFLPVLDEPEAGRLLIEWSIDRVCRAAASSNARVPVILGLDARTIPDRGLVDLIDRARRRFKLRAGSLCLGILEATFRALDSEARDCLASLRAKGVEIILDEYTGAELPPETIRVLPIDRIRMAATALYELETDIGAFARLQAVTGLAASIGIAIGMRGVETLEQIETLRRFGFSEAQGSILGDMLSEQELSAAALADESFVAPGGGQPRFTRFG